MIDSREAVVREIRDKNRLMENETLSEDLSLTEEYILDRTDVKVIFITLYTIVFISCFLGNLMVIFVVTFSRRLRSITNFFLANLAIADFCVGVFCVYQTLTNYLMNSWQLGDLAIVYPIKCRFVLTRSRLQFVIVIVWVVAAIYAFPKFFYVETVRNRLATGDVDIISAADVVFVFEDRHWTTEELHHVGQLELHE